MPVSMSTLRITGAADEEGLDDEGQTAKIRI